MTRESTETTDVTQWKAEVARLREENASLRNELGRTKSRSDLLLRRVLDVLPVGGFIADEHGGIAWTNAAAERIWGGARHVPLDRITEYKGWWSETGEPVREWAFGRAFTKGETSTDEIIDIECFDGSRKTILNSAAPVRNERGEIVSAVAVISDITQMRRTEKSLRDSRERLSRAISIDSVGVLFFDMESNFLDANDAFLRMIGHSREELERGELRSELVTLPEWMPRTQQVFEEAVEAKQQLMRELNHRVKNNLYLVSNLILLKDESLGESADLSDIRGHVSTIFNLHERLYEQDAVRHVEFEPYVRSLLTDVFSFWVHGKVDLQVQSEVDSLSADTTATLGLILNEIATNAMKHGYEESVRPSFAVLLEEVPAASEYVLTVSQNGRPFPDDATLPEPGSSGLGLVQMLASQLKGSMELEREPAPTFRIRFPRE